MSVAALLKRASRRPARVVLAGGDAALLEEAAGRLRAAGVTEVNVVGSGALRPSGHDRLQLVASLLRTREPNRVRDGIDALDLAADPIRFAAGLAALGDADAVVAGPGVPPGDLLHAVAWTIGGAADGGPVHSVHWLLLADGGLVAFADCAAPGELSALARARLAWSLAKVHGQVGTDPARIAFLAGPAEPAENDPARQAVELLRVLDAGIMAEASATLRFRDRANVFIFPGGTAGHLAARSVRVLAGARLLGPLVLGPPATMAGVADDADVDELVGTAALAVLATGRPAT